MKTFMAVFIIFELYSTFGVATTHLRVYYPIVTFAFLVINFAVRNYDTIWLCWQLFVVLYGNERVSTRVDPCQCLHIE